MIREVPEKLISGSNIRKEGLVILLDALGVSTLTLEGCEDFLSKRNAFLEDLNKQVKLRNKGLPKPIYPQSFTFGDTILFCLEHPIGDQLIQSLGGLIADLVFWCIPYGLHAGIALRGAFSLGEYLVSADTSTVLGPAISDAAAWYEQAEWIGIVATPSCGNYISVAMAANETDRPYTVQFDVPLRKGGKRRLWTTPWSDGLNDTKAREEIHRYFTYFDIPFGAEMKYQNTTDFVDWCINSKESRLQNIESYKIPTWKTVRKGENKHRED